MNKKLVCPKCGNDSFKLTIKKKENPIKNVLTTTILYITCAKCGWSTKKYRHSEKHG